MLDLLEREKGIKRDVLVEAISTSILAASKKSFTSGTRELRIEINPQSGAIRAMAKLIVAEKVTSPHEEILLSKAKAIKADAQSGEEIEVEVTPRDFGRIAAQAARQAINQRLRQIEREMIYDMPHAGEAGGLSGRPLQHKSTEVIRHLAKALNGALPIIGVGGIDSAMAAREKLAAGASLVQIYSGFIYKGPALIREAVDAIAALPRT